MNVMPMTPFSSNPLFLFAVIIRRLQNIPIEYKKNRDGKQARISSYRIKDCDLQLRPKIYPLLSEKVTEISTYLAMLKKESWVHPFIQIHTKNKWGIF